MENTTLIKKYSNRKLYDTDKSKYVTLVDLKQLMVDGKEFKVINMTDKQDITNETLMQILAYTVNLSNDKIKEVILQG